MGRIPEETIQQVIAASDIVAIIGSYFPLRRAGSAYKALCPFHNERTPSFQVNPSRQIFKCFGCGAGGSVIKFIEMHEHVSFGDAVRRLAERAGIPIIEEEDDGAALVAHRQRKQLLTLHREATLWFHELLLKSPQAEPARRYWRSRGFDGQVARRWQIGFAPPQPAAVLAWAREKKFSEALLAEGGLMLFANEEGQRRREPWFRFAGRLMFPVCNEQGEVIAFSGRLLEADAQAAKYLNSPETPLFNKSRVFFGMDRARQAIAKQKQALICEGQMDLIRCVEAGVSHIVAPLGTAFTEHHARRLRQLADEVVLCFDSDGAGIKAAGRAFAKLAQAGLFVRVAALPPGADPDSFVRTQGPDAFRELVAAATPYFDFQLETLTRMADLTQVRERLRVAGELAQGMACLSERAALEEAINRTATRLAVPTEDVRRLVARAARDQARTQRAETAAGGRRSAAESTAQASSTEEPLVMSDPSLRLLCRLLLTDVEATEWLRENDVSWLRELPDTELLLRLWNAEFRPDSSAAVMAYIAGLPTREQEAANNLLAEIGPAGGGAAARAAFYQLKARFLRNQIDQRQARLRTGGESPETVLALTAEVSELTRQLRELTLLSRLPPSLTPF